MKQRYLLLLTSILSICSTSFGQLVITPTGTAASLTAKLAGSGITIVSDTLICNALGNGTFVSTGTLLGIDSGIMLCTGKVADATGAECPPPGCASTNFGAAGDADLLALCGGSSAGSTHDACELIIHFVPHGDTVSFRYQFGSQEYYHSTCGSYNDAFGFFISGPGITTALPGANMALVPGTTVPVAINTINSGTPGTFAGCNIANCTSYGSGSPFPAYFIDNTGGTQLKYVGYTRTLKAFHNVIPCDTYRIKLAIVDAGNGIFDSGVFIEAGSLKTNGYHFDRADSIGYTVDGLAHTVVKGCRQDTIHIKSNYAVPYPKTLYLTKTGTAVAGTDYTAIPDSVVIPAGDTSTFIVVNGLVTPTSGTTSLNITLFSPTACGIVDSISLNIMDHPYASILTHDTSVCNGTPVHIIATGSAGLSYSWTPATYLDNPASMTPICTPTSPGTTIYTMTATLPGAGCANINATISVSMFNLTIALLTHDTTICSGDQFTIRVDGPDTVNYLWSPAGGLSNATTRQPQFIGNSTATYTVTATLPGLATCNANASLTVTVVNNDFQIVMKDTSICDGAIVAPNAYIVPAVSSYTYSWTGPNSYSSTLLNPVTVTGIASSAGTYVLTVTNQGLCVKQNAETISLYPTPGNLLITTPIEICQYAPTKSLHVDGYDNLIWYTNSNFDTTTVIAPMPNTETLGVQHYHAAQISFTNNCIGPVENIDVTVINCCNGTVYVPSAFTPNGDGLNDRLKVVRSSEYKINVFSIFNRWGQCVFNATIPEESWDGTFEGQPCDLGTYYYYLVVNCTNSDKQPLTMKGEVTLIK